MKFLLFSFFVSLSILFIPFGMAVYHNSTIQYINDSIELNLYCENFIDESLCDSSTKCYAKMYYPNYTKIMDYSPMSCFSPGWFNYTFSDLNNTLSDKDLNKKFPTKFYCYNDDGITPVIIDYIYISDVSSTGKVESASGSASGWSPVGTIGPITRKLTKFDAFLLKEWNIDVVQNIKIKCYDNYNDLVDVADLGFYVDNTSIASFISKGYDKIGQGEYNLKILPIILKHNELLPFYNITFYTEKDDVILFKTYQISLKELKGWDKFLHKINTGFKDFNLFVKEHWIIISIIGFLFLLMLIIIVSYIVYSKEEKK